MFRSKPYLFVLCVGVVSAGGSACSESSTIPAADEPGSVRGEGAGEEDLSAMPTELPPDDVPPVVAPPERNAGSLLLRCLGNCSTADMNKANVEGAGGELGQHGQAQSDPVLFDMGDLHASREFLFLLVNPGDTDVTDIVLNSDNPSFSIEPAAIDRLPPQKDAVILPVIRVLAAHGISLNGVGSVSLLPMGVNTATIEISGSSANDGGQTEATQASAVLQVAARIMDVELYDGPTQVDLRAPVGASSSTLGGLGFVNLYYAPSTEASLVNTGNVDIEVTVYHSTTAVFTSTLAVDSALELPYEPGFYAGVRLQSNTVADGSRFQIGNDGAAYFLVSDGL